MCINQKELCLSWAARTLIMTLGMLGSFALFSSPTNAQTTEQIEAVYGNDEFGLIAHREETSAYSLRPDLIEVYICHTTSGIRYKPDRDRLDDQLHRQASSYFRWLSGGLYDPKFIMAGTVNSAKEKDCYAKAAEHSRSRSKSKEITITGIIVMNDTDLVTHPSITSGERAWGWGGPGYFCVTSSQHSCNYPDNFRTAIINSNTAPRGRGYRSTNTLVHEIGHMLAFPHSFSGDTLVGESVNQYDNNMDIMSGGKTSIRFGTLAINRYAAGWIPKDQVIKYPVSEASRVSGELYDLMSLGRPGKQMLVLPVQPGKFYALGARVKSGYDDDIPSEGVEVYFIDQSGCGVACARLRRRTTPVVAAGSSVGELGHVYAEGQVIVLDDTRGVRVRVLEQTADGSGYRVWVGPGPLEGHFFDDEGSPHETSINWLATEKITQGCVKPGEPGERTYRFCPQNRVTRAQMAVFLARFLDPTVTADDEASTGFITRGEMAVMLNRALKLDANENRNTVFTDVPAETELATAAANLYAAGITQGCHGSRPLFCPDDSLTRAQMATFLYRSRDYRDLSDDDNDNGGESSPDGKGIRISWGTDASDREGCPQGAACRNYSYRFIGDFGAAPYTLECWIDGERRWPRPGEGPRVWFGDPKKGCWLSGSDETVSHVVVNGIKSNELPWVQSTDTREVQISMGKPSTRCPKNGECWGLHRDYHYELTGFGPGPYTLECWAKTSGGEWHLSGKLSWHGDSAKGCYSWGESGRQTVYVVVDGVKSNELPWANPRSGLVAQSGWYVNDAPTLGGTESYWRSGQPGRGYGDNNYVYMLADSDASDPDNTALWEMGNRIGRQVVQVYIPSDNATATVDYKIRIHRADNTVRSFTRSVRQVGFIGWVPLITIEPDGSEVSILVEDNGARQDWETDGEIWSSIGIDAIRMRCVSNCTPDTSVRGAQSDDREVRISWGDDLNRDPDLEIRNWCRGYVFCRDFSYELIDFDPGPYTLECWLAHQKEHYWRNPSWAGPEYENKKNRCRVKGNFQLVPYVFVDGVKSNELRWVRSDDEGTQPDGQESVQTEWHVNDKPSLSYWDEGDESRKIQSLDSTVWGRDPAWWRLRGEGYSQGDSYYTFAIGGASVIDNQAEWRMGSRVGTQEIQIYIPGNSSKPFTATVDYEIQIAGEPSQSVRIEQERDKGWVSLGRFDLNGAEVTIRVDDTNAYPHHTPENEHESRIGINAVRMRCVSGCTP